MKYNSLNIKLGLCLVHTFTFVTSLLEKACKFCRTKLSNQHNNIGDERGSFVVSLLQQHRHIHHMNYQRKSISFFPSMKPLTDFNPSLQWTWSALSSLIFELNSVIFSLAQPQVEPWTSHFLTCPINHVQVGNYFGSSRYEVALNHDVDK